MRLPTGTRLGPFEVVAPLGAGGMGEVYRARDTRLERDVALKVLASEVSLDPERRSRFEREAKAIAALTHPHICTLHDVGHDGDVEYLVMELLEGTTLADRLASGPMPQPEALAAAIQIADALAAAHRLGIVHRDLKPANIMLVRPGKGRASTPHVKLLDFGLAKLRAEQPPLVGAPTMTAPLTGQGQILGTLHYMAPEQLEGRPVDARADIFAFGAIVFEMMTGRRAFGGGSTASVIGAILREPAPPISLTVPLAPPALDRVVSTCLAKDPDERWSSAHDVLLQLRDIAEGTSPSGSRAADDWVAGPAARAGTPPATSWLARWWLAIAVAAGILGVLAGAMGRTWVWPAPADPAVQRLSILPADGTTLTRGDAPQISPDGRLVAFLATDRAGRNLIHVRPLDSLDARALPGTEDASLIFWAPDSRRLGFFAGGQLKTVALAGGAPQSLAAAPVPRGGSWSKDDVIIFVGLPANPPRVVPAGGGESTPVPMPPAAQRGRWFPVFLPDGRHYLYLGASSGQRTLGSGIHLGSLDSPESREILPSTASVAYADPGFLFFRRDAALMAQRFDLAALEVRGAATQVADNVGYNGITYQGLFSVSADGTLVYQSAAPASQLLWFDRRGVRIAEAAPPADYGADCLTADDARIVYDLVDQASGMVDIWSVAASGGAPTRLTFDRLVDFYPVCGPTGQDVAFASLREGPPNILRLSVGTPGSETVVLRSPLAKIPSDWSRDGRWLVFSELNSTTGFDVRVLPLAGGDALTFAGTPAVERNGRLSPDARWLAYESSETGVTELYLQPFPATGARWQVSRGGGSQAYWRRDGKELFYLAQDRRLMAVAVTARGPQLDLGESQPLFQTRATGHEPTSLGLLYAASADGQRFIVNTATDGVLPITIVRNWPALLR